VYLLKVDSINIIKEIYKDVVQKNLLEEEIFKLDLEAPFKGRKSNQRSLRQAKQNKSRFSVGIIRTSSKTPKFCYLALLSSP
jgi:hypothetical protein